jgi:DNA-binding NtrC family response regulator
MMSNNNHRNILWTATDAPLPKGLWDRLEGLGYRVLLGNGDDLSPGRFQKLSPSLWVCQAEGAQESGLAKLRNVRAEFPDLPIVLLSNRPSIEEAVTAIKSGITDYVPEGTSPERLWLTIEGALQYPEAMRGRGAGNWRGAKGRKGPIAFDPRMRNLIKLAKRIAPSRSTVMIQGESGTGKEVIARYIHENSDRRGEAFVAVNCAALPENLLESELFGHEKGAFTGAVARKKGKFELADGGTLLLDEISEMAVSIQAKLLRVLQEREIDRVGGQLSVAIDARVIATTNRDLREETEKGRFRPDLFYRLNVVPLALPPLRKRPEDIVPLAVFFLETHCACNQVPSKRLSPEAEDFLIRRSWPGNVRELENLMERASLLIESDVIQWDDLEAISIPGGEAGLHGNQQDGVVPLKDMEKRMIFRALQDHNGNRTHAAKVLGISVRTLRNKLHEYEQDPEGEALASRG